MSGKRDPTVTDLMGMEPMELAEYLGRMYSITIPLTLTDANDLKLASEILSTAANAYSFLSNMRIIARVQKRALKRQRESAKEIEDMLAREEIFENQAAVVKQAYETVSRMVTIKQQIDQELKML